jgi:hypothetical protein
LLASSQTRTYLEKQPNQTNKNTPQNAPHHQTKRTPNAHSAYPPALEQLAPQIRLKLAQADDARRFAGLGPADPLAARCVSVFA